LAHALILDGIEKLGYGLLCRLRLAIGHEIIPWRPESWPAKRRLNGRVQRGQGASVQVPRQLEYW
jgi:hypothetical protein